MNPRPLLFALGLLFLLTPLQAQNSASGKESPAPDGLLLTGSLDLKASGTTRSFLVELLERFGYAEPGLKVSASFPSSNGVKQLLFDGKTRLGVMSRALNSGEQSEFKEKFSHPLIELPLALDAIRIVVHEKNPLKEITVSQLNGIYAEKPAQGAYATITNWGELRVEGDLSRELITSYGGDPEWGTTLTFESLIMDGGKCLRDVQLHAIESIPSSIAEDPKGIGYTCLGPEVKGVKTLSVAQTDGEPAVEPTREKIASGEYPLSRRFYLYLHADPAQPLNPAIRAWLNYLYSSEAQAVIANKGFIPLDPRELKLLRQKISQIP